MSETPSEFFRQRGFELNFTTHTHGQLVAIYEKTIAGLSSDVQADTRRAIADG